LAASLCAAPLVAPAWCDACVAQLWIWTTSYPVAHWRMAEALLATAGRKGAPDSRPWSAGRDSTGDFDRGF